MVKTPIDRAGERRFLKICAAEREIYEKAGGPSFLAGIYATVETTQGPGAICEKITGPSMRQYVQTNGLDAHLLEHIGATKALLLQHRIMWRDTGVDNAIVAENGIVIIDGTYDKAIHLSKWFDSPFQSRLLEKFRLLVQGLEVLHKCNAADFDV